MGPVFDAPGTPGYPPPRNTWEFPPPEVSRAWKWIAVLVGIGGLLAAGTLTTLLVVFATDDFAGFIEDEDLTDTISSQCVLMTLTVESLPITGSTPQQAAAITDQNRAVEIMVQAIRSAHPTKIREDDPAEQWLRDWERLVDARATYAEELLRDPGASLSVPTDADGNDITDRMDDVWLGESVCEVPDVLASPYTDAYSGV